MTKHRHRRPLKHSWLPLRHETPVNTSLQAGAISRSLLTISRRSADQPAVLIIGSAPVFGLWPSIWQGLYGWRAHRDVAHRSLPHMCRCSCTGEPVHREPWPFTLCGRHERKKTHAVVSARRSASRHREDDHETSRRSCSAIAEASSAVLRCAWLLQEASSALEPGDNSGKIAVADRLRRPPPNAVPYFTERC